MMMQACAFRGKQPSTRNGLSVSRYLIMNNMNSCLVFIQLYICCFRWPQFTFPPFKIVQNTCLQKVRIGEQVCFIRSVPIENLIYSKKKIVCGFFVTCVIFYILWEERMKVPWPLAERELIVHYFLFEYFKDGLVVILLNTVKNQKPFSNL